MKQQEYPRQLIDAEICSYFKSLDGYDDGPSNHEAVDRGVSISWRDLADQQACGRIRRFV
jgi:hypothetical protein